jgi:hypothetical protein
VLPYTVGHDAGNFWLVSASNIILFANGSNALSRTIDGLRLPLLLSLDDLAWRLKPQKEFGLLVVGVRPSNLLRAKADNEELAPCTRQRPNSRVRTQTFGDMMHDDADVPQSLKYKATDKARVSEGYKGVAENDRGYQHYRKAKRVFDTQGTPWLR